MLCRVVADESDARDDNSVDRFCEELSLFSPLAIFKAILKISVGAFIGCSERGRASTLRPYGPAIEMPPSALGVFVSAFGAD
jgi:hypothetical protein